MLLLSLKVIFIGFSSKAWRAGVNSNQVCALDMGGSLKMQLFQISCGMDAHTVDVWPHLTTPHTQTHTYSVCIAFNETVRKGNSRSQTIAQIGNL